MTEPAADDDLDPIERLATSPERRLLEGFLDELRASVRRKATGLTDEQAARALVPSGTSVGGLVKHLRWMELTWFQNVLAGRPWTELPPRPDTPEDPEAQFRMAPGERIGDLIDAYDEECARSRAVAALLDLDATGQRRRVGAVSLRWVHVHVIQETARHLGHLDILREQLDGSTGE